MSTYEQIGFVVKKNLLVSLRNKEFLIESILPIVVAAMLSLKAQLQAIQQLMPLLYCIALTSTQRSMLIKLVEEKSKRYKELQKIMGMNDKAYTIGWILTGYIILYQKNQDIFQIILVIFQNLIFLYSKIQILCINMMHQRSCLQFNLFFLTMLN